jgi:hypothetical protein
MFKMLDRTARNTQNIQLRTDCRASRNTHGPIINAIGSGDVSAVPGGYHPFTNFRS